MNNTNRVNRISKRNQLGQINLDFFSALHGFPGNAVNKMHHFIHFILRPLHLLLVVGGIALLVFSTQAHAYDSPSNEAVRVSVSTNELALQPGSELPVRVNVSIPPYSNQFIPVSFQADYPPELTVDGQLQSVDAWFSLSRIVRIGARQNAPQGMYPVTVTVRTIVNNVPVTHVETIQVWVGPKSRITYFTSPNTTLAPSLSHIVFSQSALEMTRSENASFTVSFVHNGSSTDYLVRFAEQPIFIKARVVNSLHSFVDNGQVVSSTVEVSTSPTTSTESFPLYLEAYNMISGEKIQLGTVMVNVRPVINISASMPFQEYRVESNKIISTYLTLTNSEYGDQDMVIQSSSSLVAPGVHQVNVPSKSSVSIPVQVFSGDEIGTRVETLYVMNAQFTKQVSLVVRTIPASEIPSPISDQNNSFVSVPTGLVSGVVSPIIGILFVIFALLLIFSKKFRDYIRARLPKPASPVTKDVKKSSSTDSKDQ